MALVTHFFTVENWSDGKRVRCSETSSTAEAYQWVKEAPASVVTKTDSDGWIVDEWHFSPKHTPPSKEKFVKWGNSRGKQASKMLRRRFS